MPNATARVAGRHPAGDVLQTVTDLFRAAPGCDPDAGVRLFLTLVDHAEPWPARLVCPGLDTRELARALDWPVAAVRPYVRALEGAGVIAPLPGDARGATGGWRLDLDRLASTALAPPRRALGIPRTEVSRAKRR